MQEAESYTTEQKELSENDINRASSLICKVKDELSRHVIGQDTLKDRLLVALIAKGHVLLEGVPGLAKTLCIKALAQCLEGSFSRIQFTPDLLPADIVGSEVYRPEEGKFLIRKGPVFAHFVLADEINRAPAKVQSALLETMQEHQVTIGDQSIKTPQPFFVLATQNPLEQEGTYPLPEAQIDRFMFKLVVGYPDKETESKILELVADDSINSPVRPQVSLQEFNFIQDAASKIYVDSRIRKYIVDIVTATRDVDTVLGRRGTDRRLVELGASPRASISLFLAARAEALIQGYRFVTPQIVKDLAHDILRHRIIMSYEAELEKITVEDIISQLLSKIPVP